MSDTKTPCVGVCTATAFGDEECRGCKRTFEEVRDWIAYTDQEKADINRRIKEGCDNE